MRAAGFVVSAALASAISIPAVAENAPAKGGQSVQQRRDDLARAQEALNDPDPLTRLATMEALVASGDATGMYVALRTALASDDPAMRNLAVRTWIASLKRLNLSVLLPDDLQKQVDAALVDPKAAGDLFQKLPWLAAWSRRGFQVALGFTDVDVSKNTGKVFSLPGGSAQNAVDFTIGGSTLFFTIGVDFMPGGATCQFTISPNTALVVTGVVACGLGGGSPQLKLSAPML